MIFVTVGTQLPFPRLMHAVADIVRRDVLQGEEVVVQTGEEGAGSVDLPDAVRVTGLMSPSDYNDTFTAARIILGHAGVGTVLSAERFGKPLVLMPRSHAKREHRNDHQIATARQLEGRPGLTVVWKTEQLEPALLSPPDQPFQLGVSPTLAPLISELRGLIALPKVNRQNSAGPR